jgi:peptide/nickel transport system permease protein
MTQESLPLDTSDVSGPSQSQVKRQAMRDSFIRIAKYTGFRTISLFLTIVVGVYLTILIANMGGYVDEIRRNAIRETTQITLYQDPQFRQLPAEQQQNLVSEAIRIEEERLGLNKPFVQRSFDFLIDAMTLNLGFAQTMASDSGSKQVRLIILERLPSTLVLFTTAQFLLFFGTLFIGLSLSRNYGSWFDRLVVTLAPTSAAPGWFYGIFLILIFAAVLGVLPYGGMVSAPPPENTLDYLLSLAKHMILPVSAILIGGLFQGAYGSRTFFLIYSSEDYVEMAKAKGLSDRDIERRYILRPTLPTIITNFALALIGLWLGAPILETIFNWPGLGRALLQGVNLFDIPVIVGSTVLFAYLLAITVFLLDFIYALVDPRVKVGG